MTLALVRQNSSSGEEVLEKFRWDLTVNANLIAAF